MVITLTAIRGERTPASQTHYVFAKSFRRCTTCPRAIALPKTSCYAVARLRGRCIVFRHRHRTERQPFPIHETGNCASPVPHWCGWAPSLGRVRKIPTEYFRSRFSNGVVGKGCRRTSTGFSHGRSDTHSPCACVRQTRASNSSRMMGGRGVPKNIFAVTGYESR